MNWAHLPLAGGIYDQHPDLLEQWLFIFDKIAEKEQMDRRAEEAKSRRGAPTRVAGRRR